MPHDYCLYIKIDLKTIDPNGEVPEWDITFRRTNPFEKDATGNKRRAEESPQNQNSKKRNKAVPEWRVGEFLWMFLEGKKTTPDYELNDVDSDSEDMDNAESFGEAEA